MKNHLTYFLFGIALLGAGICTASAQSISSNDISYRQEGNEIVITYAFSYVGSIKEMKGVQSSVSLDGGKTFRLMTAVSGDVGSVSTKGVKEIRWRIFDELGYEDIAGNVSFQIECKEPRKNLRDPYFWLEYNALVKNAPLGLRFAGGKGWGGYIGFNVSLSTPPDDYQSSYSGIPAFVDGYYSGKPSLERSGKQYFTFTGGVLKRIFPWLYVYSGAGYGRYRIEYRAENASYVEKPVVPQELSSPDISIYFMEKKEKMVLECGVMVALGGRNKVTVSCGYHWMPGTDLRDLSLGVGVRLGDF